MSAVDAKQLSLGHAHWADMRVGNLDYASRHQLAGWAAEERRPDAALTIVIEVDGAVVARIAAGEPRPDLVVERRFATPDHGFTYRFAEMLDPAQPHRIAVRYAAGLELLPGGERIIEADPSPRIAAAQRSTLSPILVTSPGRSGSTWLMGLLARSPGIVVTEIMPYEMRLVAYYAHAHAVLTAPGDRARSTHPDRIASDRFHIGYNPHNIPPFHDAFHDAATFSSYTDVFLPTAFAESFRRAIVEFYTRLAVDQGKPNARYFAEKTNHLHRPTRRFVRRIFDPVREIVLVRDPRDVLASHLAFFGADADRAFATLTEACRDLLAVRHEGRADVLILRYEDLVTRRSAGLSAVSDFLDLEIDTSQDGAEKNLFQNHATSASPETSIGRWRTILPPALQGRCCEAWKDFLDRFEY